MTQGSPSPPPHRLHDEALEQLLASGERRQELVALLGPRGYRELSALARRARDTRRGGPPVYVLPGLMGSRIGTRGRLLDDVIWLDLVEVAAGHLVRLALPRGARLVPLGAMWLNSLRLKLSLQVAGFDARLHPYDWRRSVEDLARELNSRIAAEGGREVMLVGHSMGGVVARVALAADAGHVARVVQIGAPNRGSFAPVLALRAVYPTVRKLAALDLYHDAEDLARIVFRSLPALHELLPEPRPGEALDLFDPAAWPDDPLRPLQQLLADAAAARARWPAADPRCLHIVGVRQETVTHATLHGSEFRYTLEHDGDGTVPRALAMLPGATHWFVGEKHGGLPNNARVISAVVDLLRHGSTERLPGTTRRGRVTTPSAVTESALRRVAPRKLRWQDLSPDARRRLLEPVVSPEFHGPMPRSSPRQAAATPGDHVTAPRTFELRLMHGNIAEASARAIVLGLFRNVDPSGAANAVDAQLGGLIRQAAHRRMFDASLGRVTSLPVTRGALLADFVVLAGLGDFDDFASEAQALVAGNVVRMLAAAGVQDFATVLFGAGSGVPVATAVEQQLGGFVAGLGSADDGRVVRRVTLCEVDARKYATLRRVAVATAARLSGPAVRIVVDEGDAASGAARDLDAGPARSRGQRADPAYLVVTLLDSGRGAHECRSALLTAGAKAAVLGGRVRVARKTLRAQLARAESGQLGPRDMARFGDTLARLLLPEPVRDGLQAMRRRPLIVVHDGEGSRIPWETLRIGEVHPALEGGLTRRYASESLTVARWSQQRTAGTPLQVLMVVNPTLDLPGAADEGAALARMLRAAGASVELLSGTVATRDAVLRAFGSGRHDALHFAGHGFFAADDPGRSGLVCAEGEVLRGADVTRLGELPALVFFNACEAARVRRPRRPTGARRLFAFRRSTSVAEGFLAGGVANFLGTHWPVGDQAAFAFSTSFYQHLLQGAALGDCVLAARSRVLELDSIDWADYVLYGSPDFAVGRTDHG